MRTTQNTTATSAAPLRTMMFQIVMLFAAFGASGAMFAFTLA